MNLDQPWERQPWERDDLAWTLFQEYLAQPQRPRNLRTLLRHGIPVTWTDLEMYALDHGWETRARLYDRHLDKLRLATIEAEVQEDARAMARRHGRASKKAVQVAEAELDHLLAIMKRAGGGGILTPRDTIRFLTLAVKLERLVTDQSTAQVEATVDLSNLTADDLRALRAIQQKAEQGT